MTRASNLSNFASWVCGQSLLVRTGIVLFDARQLGQELDAFARAGLDTVDFPDWLLARAHPDSRYLNLTFATVLSALDRLCEDPNVNRCLGVAGFDLVLSGLSAEARARTWGWLHRRFRRRPRSLLFLVPKSAVNVLPRQSELRTWTDDGRVIEI